MTFVSFGFKFGLPTDLDLLFDVRFLRNPNYEEPLAPQTGEDAAVGAFIESDPSLAPFLAKVADLLDFLVPRYLAEGKSATDDRDRMHRRPPPFGLRRAAPDATTSPKIHASTSPSRRATSRERRVMRERFTPTRSNGSCPASASNAGFCSRRSASSCLLDAATRWLIAEGAGIHVNEILDGIVDDYFPAGVPHVDSGDRRDSRWSRPAFGCGFARSFASRAGAAQKDFATRWPDRRLQQGYKIVAIGGGTGLSTLLRGLKRRTSNLTAVVTVSDDGGSSGRLSKELGVLPPGDIRNCLVALADDEALVTDLFRYRFTEGEGLSGHSFGNFFSRR